MANDSDDMTLILALLSPREREPLKLRFGLEDGVQRSREEMALLYGWSLEKVQKTETMALRKMRPSWRPPPPPNSPLPKAQLRRIK
jgi:DNA-directed RNA polymerase sigma subunit (sigma70/sigma32)